ncbi:MAG TPA: hypothetical protein VM536_20130, partial [Chloroflexia bacterium]|nr:hypothetical protein [Chloroflexia bacterium]
MGIAAPDSAVTLPLRTSVLAAFGAGPGESAELLAYNANRFEHARVRAPLAVPLPPEPHVAAWTEYAQVAATEGVLPALTPRLVQLAFPISAGISETPAYRDATRRGVRPDPAVATGLQLRAPEAIQLLLHPSVAGPIPLLVVPDRHDFVALVQALSRRNEPQPVPDSMGACMVGGLNNWDRVRRLRAAWEADTDTPTEAAWAAEFARLVPHKSLYQDRLILVSEGPYSGVSASALGLTDAAWGRLSLLIRIEHECTHYFTRRVLGGMSNNLLDELIADCMGLIGATGTYPASWFLHFVGLEAAPVYRAGGRLENYRGAPPLSDSAFAVLGRLVVAAAEHL